MSKSNNGNGPRALPVELDGLPGTTRRDILRGAAGLAVLGVTGIGCGNDDSSQVDGDATPDGGTPQDDNRVAIVGGGAAGIATAYLLDGTYNVDVFEARPQIGGHCDSRTVDYLGHEVTIDVGAQFFHPATHPIYATLLEILGLFDPEDLSVGETLEGEGSLCVFPMGGGKPAFASSKPLANPIRAIDFGIYTGKARSAIEDGLSWDVTIDEWIASLSSTADFKDNVLYPWLTSLIGTTRADAARSSARSILQTFALSFPDNILDGASTFNSKIGLQGNLQRMLDQSTNVSVLLSAAATELRHDGGFWYVRTDGEEHGPYRSLVLNAPPRIGRELLRPLSWTGEIVELMDRYEYFDTRLVIHRDPIYVHEDRDTWAMYNTGVDGLESAGSAWVGALHEPLPDGSTVDLFKSWAQHRSQESTDIVFERSFKHPLITPTSIGAARELAPHQGKNDLYFGGTYTAGMDLQESAVYSAIKVAERLAPDSQTLAGLQTRLSEKGLENISYDL